METRKPQEYVLQCILDISLLLTALSRIGFQRCCICIGMNNIVKVPLGILGTPNVRQCRCSQDDYFLYD